jgi:hypothetical protein
VITAASGASALLNRQFTGPPPVSGAPTPTGPSPLVAVPGTGGPVAGRQVSTALGGGGSNLKSILLYGAAGAVIGTVFPVIPGGPLGGAIIGALLAMFG